MSQARPLDRLLVGVFVLSAALWMVRAHQASIDGDERKAALHARILANDAEDPYQYKNHLITLALEQALIVADTDLDTVFEWNTLLSLLFLATLHHFWLRQWAGPKRALIGTFVLAALANVLFLGYYHHPYEFWGVGLFCLLLVGFARDWDWRVLCLVGLVTGLVWEKHALVAVIWVLVHWFRRERVVPTALKGLAFLACCLAVPIGIRLWLDHGLETPRGLVDGDTPLSAQKWELVLWYQSAFVVPFVLLALARWRVLPSRVRWLWLYLPVLVLAYVSRDYILHEVRSFWALVPVFTATVVAWIAAAAPTREPASERPEPRAALPTSPPAAEAPDSGLAPW